MYSHLTQAVATEQTVDKLELAAAHRLTAKGLRPADEDEDERLGLAAAASPTHGRRAHVRWPGRVAAGSESGCASA